MKMIKINKSDRVMVSDNSGEVLLDLQIADSCNTKHVNLAFNIHQTELKVIRRPKA